MDFAEIIRHMEVPRLPEGEYDPPWNHLIDLSKNQGANADSFIPYLKEFIDLEDTDMEWVNTAREYPDLLTFQGPETMGYQFFGTTDVAVVLRSAVRARQPKQGLVLLFDINRHVGEDEHAGAVMRVLLANMISPETRPMLVVTDLDESWHVLWVDGGRVCEGPCKHRAHAVNFIRTFLAGRLAEEEGGQDIGNRQKIQDRLIPNRAG